MKLRLITDHEVKALFPHAFTHTVAILKYRCMEDCGVGSGTLIQLGSRFFFATAAHNLVSYKDEYLYIGHTKQGTWELFPIERRWPQFNEREPEFDVGYIEIPYDYICNIKEKKFLSLNRLRPFMNFWSTRVFLIGFPAELVPRDLARKNLFDLHAMGYLTETIPLEEVKHDTVVSRDICIYYDNVGIWVDNQSSFKIPEPYGISGGGLWALPTTPKGNLWNPQDTMLIGIDRSWFESTRTVPCTQVQHWLRLVARDYSDLNQYIGDYLNSFT